MTQMIENLIEGLREELKQYGEMLALLDQQQELVLQRQAQDLLQNVAAIHAQGMAIQAARRERQQYQRNLARSLSRPDDLGFDVLIPLLPADYRPLARALVEENNSLLQRVQQRAHQNHLLLSRALDLMQKFLSSLFPNAGPGVYAEPGKSFGQTGVTHSLYEAVG